MGATMHITLSPRLKKWVEGRVEHGGYETADEYISQLIREDQRRRARQAVEAKLQEALDSGEPQAVTAATWEQSQKRVQARLRRASKPKPIPARLHSRSTRA
jgi:antitoxin ParD1/3/4